MSKCHAKLKMWVRTCALKKRDRWPITRLEKQKSWLYAVTRQIRDRSVLGLYGWQIFASLDLHLSAIAQPSCVWHICCCFSPMNRHDKVLALTSSMLLALLLLGSNPSDAAPALHSHDDVLQAAIAVVQPRAPRATVEAQTLDPRLQLRACAVPLEAEMPLGVALTARINVRVRCTAPAAWSLLVPVTISTETPVYVAQVAIRADEKISAVHLRREVRKFPGTDDCCVRDAKEILGKVLRRPLAAGSIVQRADIETADAVKRGEIVTIVTGNASFEVRASGVALADAKPGEPVRIRHAESLRVIQGRADTPGIVRVP